MSNMLVSALSVARLWAEQKLEPALPIRQLARTEGAVAGGGHPGVVEVYDYAGAGDSEDELPMLSKKPSNTASADWMNEMSSRTSVR